MEELCRICLEQGLETYRVSLSSLTAANKTVCQLIKECALIKVSCLYCLFRYFYLRHKLFRFANQTCCPNTCAPNVINNCSFYTTFVS